MNSIGCYLQKISDIERKSEENKKKLLDGKREISEFQQEIKQLEIVTNKLHNDSKEKTVELAQAQAKICIIKSENSALYELKAGCEMSRKNDDAKLWDISQSVYSDIINYCDKVQEFTSKHNITNMLKPYLFPHQEVVNKKCSSEMLTENNNIKRLKDINIKLKAELSKLNQEQNEFFALQERRNYLKYDHLNGKEFVEINKTLKDTKEAVQTLEAILNEIQKKKFQRNKSASEKVPQEIEVIYEANRGFQNLRQPPTRSTDEKRPAFVPKVASKALQGQNKLWPPTK